MTQEQATQIQDGELDAKMLVKGIVDDVDIFFNEINNLSDKFQALGNFAREEAYFELKKSTMDSRKAALSNALRQLEIE